MADVGYAASVLEMNQVEATARKLGLEVDKLEIRRAEDIVAAVEALKSEVQASPGTRVSNICQGTRLGSSANTGCRERRNPILPPAGED